MVLRRYVLLQIPGVLATVIVVGTLHFWLGLSLAWAAVIVAAWVAKDVVLYPFVKPAYDTRVPSAMDRMVGREVVADGAPGGRPGYVRLDGERWQARLADGSGSLEPGGRGKVVGVSGLTLLVEPVGGKGT